MVLSVNLMPVPLEISLVSCHRSRISLAVSIGDRHVPRSPPRMYKIGREPRHKYPTLQQSSNLHSRNRELASPSSAFLTTQLTISGLKSPYLTKMRIQFRLLSILLLSVASVAMPAPKGVLLLLTVRTLVANKSRLYPSAIPTT